MMTAPSLTQAQVQGNLFGSNSEGISIKTYTFKDGSVYTGEMKSRKPDGKGKTVFTTGDTYEGSYVKGLREGYGIYTFTDGEKYDGQWV